MGKYLKMADVFDGNVDIKYIDSTCIHELKYGDERGSNYTLQDDGFWMLVRKEHAEYASHAINSHDELVENMQYYKQEAERWELRATNEASRTQGLEAEVERLRESLKWAVNNLQFEDAFEWSDDENEDAHYAALRLLGADTE